MAGPGEAIQAEAGDAQRHQSEQDRSERLLAQRAERLAPWDADPPMLAAEARLAAAPADRPAAAPDAERAVLRAPARASARWLRARVRTASGDATGAYADMVEAERLYPMRKEYAAEASALADALRQASAAAPR